MYSNPPPPRSRHDPTSAGMQAIVRKAIEPWAWCSMPTSRRIVDGRVVAMARARPTMVSMGMRVIPATHLRDDRPALGRGNGCRQRSAPERGELVAIEIEDPPRRFVGHDIGGHRGAS
jgi:hypothetical protein